MVDGRGLLRISAYVPLTSLQLEFKHTVHDTQANTLTLALCDWAAASISSAYSLRGGADRAKSNWSLVRRVGYSAIWVLGRRCRCIGLQNRPLFAFAFTLIELGGSIHLVYVL